MVKFTHVRFGHPLAGRIHKQHKRASNPCSDPAFYKSPAEDSVLPSNQALQVSWDTSSQYAACLGNSPNIDIYLRSNQLAADGKLQKFTPISFASGSYQRTLDPKWWNGQPNIQVQLIITPTNTPLFANPIAVGPLFNITYNGVETAASDDNSTNTADPNLTNAASSGILQRGGLAPGKVAAAVLLPILIIVAAVFFYIKISRAKQAEKTRRYTQAMDARMSRISGDWQSMTAQGAQAAIVANRESGMRMSTVMMQEMQMDTRPSLSVYTRPSHETVGTRASRFNPTGERQSRISFAADVNASRERLSTYSLNGTRTSRAFRNETVPPVPAIRATSYLDQHGLGEDEELDEVDATFSPKQKAGAIPLGTNGEDIVPALRLMRTGQDPSAKSSEDLLLYPVPPTPVHSKDDNNPMSPLGASSSAPPLSPVGMMPMQPQYASFMSPDAMLKQYAEARANGAKSPTGGPIYRMEIPTPMSPIYSLPPLSPVPSTPTLGVPQYTANGMRNLTGDASLSQQSQNTDWHY